MKVRDWREDAPEILRDAPEIFPLAVKLVDETEASEVWPATDRYPERV